ncbi:uncharacterized protein LOC121864924 [Homarus americanus]|uniref:PLAC domain-containing protein n=1 Tax=Homarus americanus TaxID=6706 RepID=A0A8J5KA41_HOMAM|nr:uncharacterized protein LOC121864924 [Homarus americanus]KAG7169998.1 hypothetical protein Hamer_G012218 [Homarus americanus]
MKVVLLLCLLLLGSCYTASVLGPIESIQHGSNGVAGLETPDSTRLLAIGDAILLAMKDLIYQQEKLITERLKRIEALVSHKCGDPDDLDVSVNEVNTSDMKTSAADVLDGFMDKMSSLAQTYADDLRQEFRAETQQVVKMMREEISTLVTNSELHQAGTNAPVNNKRMTYSEGGVEESTTHVMAAVEGKTTLITRDDLDHRLGFVNHQLAQITKLLGNVSTAEVLDYSRKTFKSLDAFQPLYDSLTKVVEKCEVKEGQYYHLDRLEKILMHLTEEVDENGDVLSGVTVALEEAENMMMERLQALEEITQALNNNLKVAPTITIPQSTSTTPPGTLSTCMDSLFVGPHAAQKSSNLCKTAMRYDKCSLQIVAYHCCRTCTDAGHIPEIGPHRFLHYPRLVNLNPGL